jgi:hypothetical protein
MAEPSGVRFFGLRLQANLLLPTFGDLTASAAPDVTIQLVPQPDTPAEPPPSGRVWFRSSAHGPNGRPSVEVLRLPDGSFHLRYDDLTEFTISSGGMTVRVSWSATSTLGDTVTYLGPVLGFLLRLRGVTALHASAAAVGDTAIALVGDPGAGKSTTAAALARKGLSILTDDLLALAEQSGRFLVQPGVPRVQLWPESAEALWDAPDVLPRIVPNWEKLYLDLKKPGYSHCDRPLPLAAIYVLGERASNGGAPSVEPLRGTEALIRLVANTYANYLLDNEMKAAELAVLGRLVNQVPIRLAKAPDDRKRIPEFCDAVLEDFERIRG